MGKPTFLFNSSSTSLEPAVTFFNVPWIATPRPVLLPEERGAERWQLHGDFDATQFFLDSRKPFENYRKIVI